MSKGGNKMDNKSEEKFIIMQAKIEANRQYYYERMNKPTENLKAMIISTITSMMDQINISNYHQKIRIHQILRILPLWYRPTGGIHHWKVEILQKNGGMWTIKHNISSPTFYEILIKT